MSPVMPADGLILGLIRGSTWSPVRSTSYGSVAKQRGAGGVPRSRDGSQRTAGTQRPVTVLEQPVWLAGAGRPVNGRWQHALGLMAGHTPALEPCTVRF